MQTRYDVIRAVSMMILWAALIVTVIAFVTSEAVLPDWAVLMALGALIGTHLVALAFPQPTAPPLIDQHADAVRKRKNAEVVTHPMDLLTDEDIAELRAEMKDRLRRLMGEDTAESMTSFEALLAEREQRKRT